MPVQHFIAAKIKFIKQKMNKIKQVLFSTKENASATRPESVDNDAMCFYDPLLAKNVRQITCIVIGGGNRGYGYSIYAKDFPHLLKIVAVADPKLHIRAKFKKVHSLTNDQLFTDWINFVDQEKLADVALICTPDRFHVEPAIAMAKKGYHILLEKPMATTLEHCTAIVKAAKDNNVMLCICHVLQYYPPNLKIKELIDSGEIGDVVSIQHIEPVGFYHFAHSYVRGNWRNEAESSNSLLAKSCHDIDLLCHWMPGKCISVSSFGSLNHFKADNKPNNAGERCLECQIETECPYSAVKIYLDTAKRGHYGWPVSVVTDVEDLGVLTDKLKTGPYGRCVYQCDNDVCDNQVVNLAFEGGRTASFTMIAFSQTICQRTTKVFGTKGEIAYHGSSQVSHFDFLTRKTATYHCKAADGVRTSLRGHNGADFQLIDSFVKAVMFNDPSLIRSTPEHALYSHGVVFAAERSRHLGKTLHLQEDSTWKSL